MTAILKYMQAQTKQAPGANEAPELSVEEEMADDVEPDEGELA